MSSPQNDYSLAICPKVIALWQKRGRWHYDIDIVFIFVQNAVGNFPWLFLDLSEPHCLPALWSEYLGQKIEIWKTSPFSQVEFK